MSPPPKLSRRTLTIGGIAAAATVAVAGAIYEAPKLFKHRAKSEYVELVDLLDDPDQAAVVGRAVGNEGVKDAASDLRARLKRQTLAGALADDAVQGQLMEAGGWVLPATLATLCAMAAA